MILPLMPDCCKLNAVSAPSAIIVILGSFAFRFAIIINDPLILPKDLLLIEIFALSPAKFRYTACTPVISPFEFLANAVNAE
ncbi:Uncharacterised protein [Orientia tsutsugamushi]|uniref:Uncharacterized protein n=1 Tax=Orientia tsutsugamushi TaxID=784 RepID=A0A2R8F107_ORITS|nr:Uncharacterised protein [Orientia tsutsugamushi]